MSIGTAMGAAAASFIGQVGEAVVFRRIVNVKSNNGGTVAPTNTDVTCKAIVNNYRASQITGLVQQGDIKVTVSGAALAAAGFPVPPTNQDKVIRASGKILAVQSVDSSRVSGTDVVFTLQTRG